jgi:DNA-binding NarL/FixJ family response regulator
MEKKAKVLIVEDEPTIAKEIAFNLEDNGFDIVGIAHSSEKALILLNNREVDIALLDIAINGSRNGIELAKILNNKYKIPFIYLTSFSDSDTIEEAAATHPEGYIVKPFKDSDLMPALEIALAKHQSKTRKIPALNEINLRIYENITKSEYKIIEKIWEGKINSEIAEELFISINTVKKHANNIYRKIGVDRKPNLIKYLQQIME